MNNLSAKGQTLLELVVGMSLITVVIGALAITTTYSLRNTQFSKNQALATKFAQENLEKVRTIKSSNDGVCLQGQTPCKTWDEIWGITFAGSSYVLTTSCTVTGNIVKPLCLSYNLTPANLGNGFTGQIIIEDEAASQKRVRSKVYWTDSTGQHVSELVTVFSKL